MQLKSGSYSGLQAKIKLVRELSLQVGFFLLNDASLVFVFISFDPLTWRPCWESIQQNFLSKKLHEIGVNFPEERNAFVLDYQHGFRDVTCKPAI